MMYQLSTKIDSAFLYLKNKVKGAKETAVETIKKEAGSHMLEVLGTIIIALILLIIFREHIVTLMTGVFTNLTERFKDLFDRNEGGGSIG